jgi:hypothetical protein
MEEKIITVSEFAELFQECIPSKTINTGNLTTALLGVSYTELNRCPVKTKTITDSGMTAFWQYITNSTIGYIGPSTVKYSGITSGLTNNKLFSLSEITDPRGKYYGGSIGGTNAVILQISGTPKSPSDQFSFSSQVTLRAVSDANQEFWTSNIVNFGQYGRAQSTNPASNQYKIMAVGPQLQLQLNTTGLTGIEGTVAHIYAGGSQIALQYQTTGNTTYGKYARFFTTLSLDVAQKLTKMDKIGVGVKYTGSTSTQNSPYTFNLRLPTYLVDTTISLSALWSNTNTNLYSTYKTGHPWAVTIYDKDFATILWADNTHVSTYQSGTLNIPWDTIHPILSGKTRESVYLRVPLKYAPSTNTDIYPVVLYFQLTPSASSTSTQQAYTITSGSKVYLDVSNKPLNSEMPNCIMKINISGASSAPTRYLPDAYNNTYQSSPTSLNQSTVQLSRIEKPNPHIQYIRNNGTATLYFKNYYSTSKISQLTSNTVKLNLIPNGITSLSAWAIPLRGEELIKYSISPQSY